jgi:hypothetical protein
MIGAVRYDKAGGLLLDSPRRRAAQALALRAGSGGLSSKPKYRDHHRNKKVKRKSARA